MISDAPSVEILRKLPILKNFNETECRQIADIAHIQRHDPGDVIIRQGDKGQNLWVLLDGKCEVVKHVDPSRGDSESVVLAVLEPYSHFGEMSFFHPAPHSATVKAKTAVTLLRLSRSDYQDLIAEGVWGAYKLAYNVVEELADRLRRMDEWVADLLSDQSSVPQVPEWNKFREKLFNRWNV